MRGATGAKTQRWQRKPVVTSHMSADGKHVPCGGDLESRHDEGCGDVSGHSKWATTKHKKAVVDARRGKLFAKLIKNVEVAARTGGGDPAGNPTLADAIQKAKSNSVPNDNIDRAVRRGA